jgi:hypothetical protein
VLENHIVDGPYVSILTFTLFSKCIINFNSLSLALTCKFLSHFIAYHLVHIQFVPEMHINYHSLSSELTGGMSFIYHFHIRAKYLIINKNIVKLTTFF